LIYSPPPVHAETRFQPSYVEIADSEIYERYREAESAILESREGSEYVRRKLAEVEIENRLLYLANLPSNWDSYGSDAPSSTAVHSAIAIASTFIRLGLIPDAVTPSPEGGIALCFVRNDRYADIECFNSGETLAVRYSVDEDPKAWAIKPGDAASESTVDFFSSYLSA